MVEEKVENQWEASRARNIVRGESCGKLLAWKTTLEVRQNSIKKIMSGSIGSVVEDSSRITAAFKSIFQDLYKEDLDTDSGAIEVRLGQKHLLGLSSEQDQLLCQEISGSKILAAIRKAKKGKATGPDGITSELYAALEEANIPVWVHMFNAILLEGSPIPYSWNDAVISLILKPVEIRDLKQQEAYEIEILNQRLSLIEQNLLQMPKKFSEAEERISELEDMLSLIDKEVATRKKKL
ncbi:hypothetical protein NDU88_005294 [Pleurodeles waltl]|uniref:Uncharacterized protein n=1 Tax=Pleurodeles waltl TaxID=8319 RepID=A0AAV7VIL7_PLEWA|nr:hypothetical protein NDU88_005294 [Pleurodeles waltl]